MMDIQTLSVDKLSQLCQQETQRYCQGEPYSECYGIELFRRATVQRDDASWAAIYEQYADIVRKWLGSSYEDADEGVAETFARFWRAVDEEKFGRFASLSAVLQYLKMCAHTTRLDRLRAARSAAREEPLGDSMEGMPAHEHVEDSVAARVDAANLWCAVQLALADERERLVVYLSYALGLTPREICARHNAGFSDVADVYRLKRNALDRLRRSADMRTFL